MIQELLDVLLVEPVTDYFLFYLMGTFVMIAAMCRWALAKNLKNLSIQGANDDLSPESNSVPSKEVLSTRGLIVYYLYWASAGALCVLAIGYGLAQVFALS